MESAMNAGGVSEPLGAARPTRSARDDVRVVEANVLQVRRIEVSIVVPVYRSARILPHLVTRVHELMRANGLGDRFELILVSDASPDDSWEVIRSLAPGRPFLRGICLRKNAGQHNATMAGLRAAQGDVVVIMDDDLQHPPEAIPALVAAVKGGRDVCYARYAERRHEAWKRAGSWFNDRVATLLLGKPADLYLSSFKAMRREVVQAIIGYDGPYAYVDGLLLDVTRNIGVVDVAHQARLEGAGNYNLRRSVSLWLKMATSFSVLPLRVVSIAGALVAAASALFIVAVIIEKLMHPELPAGWASLAALVLFMGGVQMLSLGIIGEYVGRGYLKLNGKPQYVVAGTVEGSGEQP
jgi:undecaprenyl-phosphate 4-deoxy-4-formamido-L-arabinose transferase